MEDAMKKNCFVLQLFGATALLLALTQSTVAQAAPTLDGVPVSMVVTVEPRHGSEVPNISGENVMVYQSRARAKVIDWVPLQGEHAGLELFILLDDSRNTSRGSQLEDIRHFIMAQPATTKIGVAYMQIGGAKIVQDLTGDHTLAANALHVSTGNLARSGSPYAALGDLIKQWPAGSDRREILMISSGVDGDYSDYAADKHDPFVDSAIERAQRAGIIVFAIRTSGEDYGESRVGPGKHYLSQVAEETGGESYYHESGPPISFVPYLDDSTHQLTRQYRLTFLAQPQKKAGMQPVKVRTEVAHAALVSADKVYVPASGQ
jgi:hypothetical protein